MPGEISYPEFMMNVENGGSISSAVISRTGTPTGKWSLYMTSGESRISMF